jgi:hypothetical protein
MKRSSQKLDYNKNDLNKLNASSLNISINEFSNFHDDYINTTNIINLNKNSSLNNNHIMMNDQVKINLEIGEKHLSDKNETDDTDDNENDAELNKSKKIFTHSDYKKDFNNILFLLFLYFLQGNF